MSFPRLLLRCGNITLKDVLAKTPVQRNIASRNLVNQSFVSSFASKCTLNSPLVNSNTKTFLLKADTVKLDIFVSQKRFLSLNKIRRMKPRTKKKQPKKSVADKRRILYGPQRKGICVKIVVRAPRKPNSGQRKCAVLRLNDGKLITAYIPGEKHNLQEHGVVLFRGGRVQDCPGIKYKIIRGKYDMN